MSLSNPKHRTERLRQPRHAGPMKLAVSLLSLLVFGWLLVTPGTVQGQSNTATTTTPTIRIELPWLDADGDDRNDFMGQTIRVSFTSSPVILRLLNDEGEVITEEQAALDGGAQAITLKGCTSHAWGEVTVQTDPGGIRTVAIGNSGPQLIDVPAGQTESCKYEVGFPRLPGVSLYPGSTIYFSSATEEVPGKGVTVYGSYSVPPSSNSRPSSTSPNPVDPLATTDTFFTPQVQIAVQDNDANPSTAHSLSGTTVAVTFRSDAIATNPAAGCSNNVTARLAIEDDGTGELAVANRPQLVDVPEGYGGGCRYAISFETISGFALSGGSITTVESDKSASSRNETIAVARFDRVRSSSGAIQTTYFTPRVEITVPNGFAGTTFEVEFRPTDIDRQDDFTGSPFECNTPEFIAAHRAAQAADRNTPRPTGSSTFTATYTVPSSGNVATGTGPRLVNQAAAYRGGGSQSDSLVLVPRCAYTVAWPDVAGLELISIDGRPMPTSSIGLYEAVRAHNIDGLIRLSGLSRVAVEALVAGGLSDNEVKAIVEGLLKGLNDSQIMALVENGLTDAEIAIRVEAAIATTRRTGVALGLSEDEIRTQAANTVAPATVTATRDRVTAEYVVPAANVVRSTVTSDKGTVKTDRTAELPVLTQTYFTPTIDINLPSLGSDNEDLNPNNDYTDFTVWVNIWPVEGTETAASARSICGEAGVASFKESDVGASRIMRVEFTLNASGTLEGDAPRLVDSPGAYYLVDPDAANDADAFAALPRCEYTYTVAELYFNELVLRMFDGNPWDIGESTINKVTEATAQVLNVERARLGLDPIDEFVDEIYPLGSLSATDSTISATYEVYATSIAFPTASDIATSYFTPDIQISVPQVDYNNDGVKDYAGTTFEIKFAPDRGSSFMCNTFDVVSAWLIEAEAWATENDNTGNTDAAPRQPVNTRDNPNAVPAHSAIYTVQDDGTVTGEAPRLPNQPNTYVGPRQLAPKCEYDVIWPINEGELDAALAAVRAENPGNEGIVSATSPGEIVVPNPCVGELTLDVETFFTNTVGATVNRGLAFDDTANRDYTSPEQTPSTRSGTGGQVQGKFLQDRPVDICNFETILGEILVREGVIGEALPTYFTPTIDIKLGPSVASRYAGETFTVRFIPQRGSAIDCGREREVVIAAAEATATSEGLTAGADYNARVVELLEEHFNEVDRPITYYYHEAEYTVQPDGSVTGTAPRLVNQADAYDKDLPNPTYDSSQPLSPGNPRYLRAAPCVYDVIWPLVPLSGGGYLRPASADALPTQAAFDAEESVLQPDGFRSIGFTDFSDLFPSTTKIDGDDEDSDHPSTARAIYFESADGPTPEPVYPERPESTRFTPNVVITVPPDDLDGDSVNDYAGSTFTVAFYPERNSVFDCNNPEDPRVAAYLEARNSATFNNQNTPRPFGTQPYTATYIVRDDGSVVPEDQASVTDLLVDQVQGAYVGGGSADDPPVQVAPCSYRVQWPEGSGVLSLGQINGQSAAGDTSLNSLTAAQIMEINDQLSQSEAEAILNTLNSDTATELETIEAAAQIFARLPNYDVRIPNFATPATDDFLNFSTKAEALRALAPNTVPYAVVSNAQKDATASYIPLTTTFTPRVNIIVPQVDEDGDGSNDYAGATFELQFWPTPGERYHAACWSGNIPSTTRRFLTDSGNLVNPPPNPPYSATYTVQPDGSVTGEGPTMVDWATYHIIPISPENLEAGQVPNDISTFAELQTRRVRCSYAVWWPNDTGSQLDDSTTGSFQERLNLLDEPQQGPIRWIDADTTASAIYFWRTRGGEERVLPRYVPLEEDLAASYFTPNLVIELPGDGTDYVGTTFEVQFAPAPAVPDWRRNWPLCGNPKSATYTVQPDGMVTGTAPRLVNQPAAYVGGGGIPNPNFDPLYDPLGLYDGPELKEGQENPVATTYPEDDPLTPEDDRLIHPDTGLPIPGNPRYIRKPGADPVELADPCSYTVVWPSDVTAAGTAAGVTLQVDTVNGARPAGNTGIDGVIRSWDKATLMSESGLSEAVVEELLMGGLTDNEIVAIIGGLLTGLADMAATDLIGGTGGLTEDELKTRSEAVSATAGFSVDKIRSLATNSVPAAIVNADQTDATVSYVVQPEALVATYFTPRVNIIVPPKDADNNQINDFSGTDIVLEFRPRQGAPTVIDSSYWCNNPDGLPEITPGEDRPTGDAVPAYEATYRIQDDGTVVLVEGTEAAGDPPSLRLINEPAAYAPDGTRALACTYSVKWPTWVEAKGTYLILFENRECSTVPEALRDRLSVESCSAGEDLLLAFYSTYLDSETPLAGIYFEPGGDIPAYVWQPDEEVDCDPTSADLQAIGNTCENEMLANTPATVVQTYFTPTVNIMVPDTDADGDGNNDYSNAAATSFTVEFFPVLGSARDCNPQGYDPFSYRRNDPSTAPYHATYTVQSGGMATGTAPRLVNQPAATVTDRYEPASKCVYDVRQTITTSPRNLILESVNGQTATDNEGLKESLAAMANTNKANLATLVGLSENAIDDFFTTDFAAADLTDNEVKAMVEGLLVGMSDAEIETLLGGVGGLTDDEIETRADIVANIRFLKGCRSEFCLELDGYAAAQSAPDVGLTAAQIQALAPNTLAVATVSESQMSANYVYVADFVPTPSSTFMPNVIIGVPQVNEVAQMPGGPTPNIYSGVSFTVKFWPTGWMATPGWRGNPGCFPAGYNYSPTRKNAPAPYTATYTVGDDGMVTSSNVPELVHKPGNAYVERADGTVPSPYRSPVDVECSYLLEISVGDANGLQLDAVDGSQISGSTGLERLSAVDIKSLRSDLTDSEIEALLQDGLTEEEIRSIVVPAADRIPIEFDGDGNCENNCLTGLTRRVLSESAIIKAAPNTIAPAVVSSGDAAARFTYVARPPKLTATYFTPIVNIGVPQNDGRNAFTNTQFVVRFRPAHDASFHCNPPAVVSQHLSEITDQLQATADNPGAQRPANSEATPSAVRPYLVTYTVQENGSVTPNDPSFRLMDQPPAYDIAKDGTTIGPAARCVYTVIWPHENPTTVSGTDLYILNRDGASFVTHLSAESNVISAIYHQSGVLPPGYIPTLEELDLVQTYFTPNVNIQVPQTDGADGNNIYSGTTFTVDFWPKRAIASSGGVIWETGSAFECNPYDFYVDKRSEIAALYERARSDQEAAARTAATTTATGEGLTGEALAARIEELTSETMRSDATQTAIRAAVETAMDEIYKAAVAAVARGDEPATSLYNIGYYSAIYTVDDDGNVASANPPRLIDQPAAYQGGGDGTNPDGGSGDSQLAAPCEYEVSISDDLDNLRLSSINGRSTYILDEQIEELTNAELEAYTGFDSATVTDLKAGGLTAAELKRIKLALEIEEVLEIANSGLPIPFARVSAATPMDDPPTFVFAEYNVEWASSFVPNIDFRIPSWDADNDAEDANDFSGTVLWVDFVPTDLSPEECPTRERRAYTIGDDGEVTAGYEKMIGGQTVIADGINSLPGHIAGSSTPCSYEITIYESGWPHTEYDISPLYLESLSSTTINENSNFTRATFAAPFSPLGTTFRPQANILVPVVDSSGSNAFAGTTLDITYSRSDETQGECTTSVVETYVVSSSLTQTTAEIDGTSANLVMSTDESTYADIIASLTDDDDANDKTICEYEIATSVSDANLAIRPSSEYYLDEPAEVPMFADYRSVSIAETTTYQIDTGQAADRVFACDAETAGSPELPRPQASVSCGVDFPSAFTGDYLTHMGQDPSGAATAHEVNIGTDALVLIRRPNVHVELSLVRLKTITLSLTTPDNSRNGDTARVTIQGTLKTPNGHLSPRLIGGEDSGFPRNYQPCYFSHARTMMIGSDGSAADVMVMAVDIDGGEDSGCEYVVSWPEISGLTTPADVTLAAGDTTATGTYTAP